MPPQPTMAMPIGFMNVSGEYGEASNKDKRGQSARSVGAIGSGGKLLGGLDASAYTATDEPPSIFQPGGSFPASAVHRLQRGGVAPEFRHHFHRRPGLSGRRLFRFAEHQNAKPRPHGA